MSRVLAETPRLLIRLAAPDDAAFICSLWNDPRVMRFVGFPNGLDESEDCLRANIEERGDSEFRQLLVAALKESGQAIGQCKMELPDTDGISETDVKLHPDFWGQRYGIEIKRALLNHLFTHTDCRVVQATPNVENIASIKMQESVGGLCVAEETFQFPESMRSRNTTPVHHYIYHVARSTWLKEQEKGHANVK
jgi:RimJ/RimL family protein N-acetyltransferase